MFKEAISNLPHMLVTIDENMNIIRFHCTIEKASRTLIDVFGKNWFDLFIDKTDVAREKKHLSNIAQQCDAGAYCYVSEIKCKSGKHKLMNFTGYCININNKRYITLLGVEHYYDSAPLKNDLSQPL